MKNLLACFNQKKKTGMLGFEPMHAQKRTTYLPAKHNKCYLAQPYVSPLIVFGLWKSVNSWQARVGIYGSILVDTAGSFSADPNSNPNDRHPCGQNRFCRVFLFNKSSSEILLCVGKLPVVVVYLGQQYILVL